MKSARIKKKIKMPVSWSDIYFGEQYRLALEYQLQPWLAKIYGFHLLKLGHLSTEIHTEECMIAHQFSMGNNDPRFNVIGDPYALPFDNKSIDACLMVNMLSYSEDPHWLLRGADRVLVDDGWLIISEFNPFSLIGMAKCIPILRKQPPFNSRMFPSWRIYDWLSVLNYEIFYLTHCQLLPWHHPKSWLNHHIRGIGTLSILVARKRTCPLTPTCLKFSRSNMKIGNALGVTKSMKKRN
ncbi:class I SAM-dependent methyltransferase [Moellerella wisconsensis]|uniref:SAM-dependent methyltransferase n=1 Tax=Moellerella wisconsensis ATCC 35017 TaxID=1354267 RepID=A0A0N1KHY1_9GAMM|nr:methyltransferase domain-containing protein [Moellerella wisconsensis]KPD03534.1 SAM-dependent methyltransferase [Moellerella wisconsensis ATCC 35017]VFS50980.1 Methyltransferase domain [Moellerella wisconsensis]